MLSDRIEAAEGPSRELFEDAAAAIWGGHFREVLDEDKGEFELFCQFDTLLDAMAWTSAAEMLVPEGWNWMAGNRNQPIARAYVENNKPGFLGLGSMRPNPQRKWFECTAATPALALCAAALRARGL